MAHAPERTINRYYDPATGQFASVDPMVNETNQPYAYAGDDPVNSADSTGLGALSILRAIWNGPSTVLHAVIKYGQEHFGDSSSDSTSCPGAVTGTGSTNFPNYSDGTQSPGPGWVWRGTGSPESNKGSWYNPSTDQSLHPDLSHADPKGPHYDYSGPDTDGETIPLYPGDPIPYVRPFPDLDLGEFGDL
jgi:uncharacterized protein RhaS with RHS repeats